MAQPQTKTKMERVLFKGLKFAEDKFGFYVSGLLERCYFSKKPNVTLVTRGIVAIAFIEVSFAQPIFYIIIVAIVSNFALVAI